MGNWGFTNDLIYPGEHEASRVMPPAVSSSPAMRQIKIGEWAEWPSDRPSQKAIKTVIEQIEANKTGLENQRSCVSMEKMAPTISRNGGKRGPGRGTTIEDLERSGPNWVTTGKILWRGNKALLKGEIPAVSRLPPHWEVSDEGEPARRRADSKIRVRDATDDELRCRKQIEAGFEPLEVSQAEIDPMREGKYQNQSGEEEDFEAQKLGFPTTRRPEAYRRTMVEQPDEDFEQWMSKFPNIVGNLATTDDQVKRAKCLIATWKDIFVENIRDMPKTDLIEHRIPLYRDAIPNVAKPVLYTQEEEEWQRTNLPKLIDAGIITQCVSPWSARSRFPRKENGSLRMVHAFMQLNRATIKANYPMRRIEPILRKISSPSLSHFFKTDASNGYWAVGVFPPHAYRLAFSSCMGQMCYLRMGQGCTGGPGTYTQLKDIVTSSIPQPNPEPALTDAMPETVAFDHFVDDDIGGANSYDDLISFLHVHYFPRLIWARLTLNPAKCAFFVPRVKILGHQRDEKGIRPSEDKLGMFREWPVPTNKDEIMRFLNTLPFLKAFIPGRADYSAILKAAIVEESVTIKRNGKQQSSKSIVDFKWTTVQQQAFDNIKKAVIENVNSGGDDTRQYHLFTDASKTGAGGVLCQLNGAETGTPINKDSWKDVSVVMFLSFQFTPAQSRYHTTERECLAVVKALGEVRWIVKGSKYPVVLYTDHQALLKVLKSEDVTGRISRWQLAISEYDLDVYHVPGKDIAVADGLSRITGYPSKSATTEEAIMASFVAETVSGERLTAGQLAEESPTPLSFPTPNPISPETTPHPSTSATQDWEKKWEEWLDDPWYATVVEFKVTGAVSGDGPLMEAERKVTERKAQKFVLIEADTGKPPELAYRERSGKLSKCVHEPQVYRVMVVLHELHGHFSDQITMKRCIGKFFWPTRHKDIFIFCRSCPMCQMIGPLRPTKGLLPVVSIQVGDVLAFDYIGPFTPIAKSGARFIGIAVDYFARFLFADAVAQATSENSVAILENKVVDKIGYPRAVYNDNGSHFKKMFSAHLIEKEVKQYFAPITHPQSVGLAERYVQLILNIFRAILQHHPHLIFVWDTLLPCVVRAANTRYIKTFGFTPAELIFGFNPRYTKGADDFEDILRSRAVNESIEELMTGEGMTLEEANYESRLAILDELRDQALTTRLETGIETAEKTSTAKGGVGQKQKIDKGSLVRLRRLAQDNQRSHKLEPRWEGPYRVHKMASHGQSAWIKDLHSDRIKGKYHINALILFHEGREVGRRREEWTSTAQLNDQTRKEVQKHAKQKADEKKLTMNSMGRDSSDFREPDVDVRDQKFQKQHLGFPVPYGDEGSFTFWKAKAVDLNRILEDHLDRSRHATDTTNHTIQN